MYWVIYDARPGDNSDHLHKNTTRSRSSDLDPTVSRSRRPRDQAPSTLPPQGHEPHNDRQRAANSMTEKGQADQIGRQTAAAATPLPKCLRGGRAQSPIPPPSISPSTHTLSTPQQMRNVQKSPPSPVRRRFQPTPPQRRPQCNSKHEKNHTGRETQRSQKPTEGPTPSRPKPLVHAEMPRMPTERTQQNDARMKSEHGAQEPQHKRKAAEGEWGRMSGKERYYE
ncbi:hypothetical protein M427DRAFT_350295 [Gonapodya prolifera JEL478]|uniref:Uncharacterized protein n=1 Tax=Gonapodya prolifera (strain JEL478) TaxID=1344416 RepID=A0A139AW97_GONPJ|nr:hypothetical protein M427DRAFT_350295 [Gonapodya prolifera JEL478]|eukprot:KXS21012.1 hypothetical protein M427DRAFT_350295 [Gonapodya prolifera JEL478]